MTVIEAEASPPKASWRERLMSGATLAARLRERLVSGATPAASFRALRLLFGLIVAISLIRFVAKDWHITLIGEPSLRFPWPGLAWVPRPSADGALALALVGAGAALLLAVGRYPRIAAAVAALAFGWLKSSDLAFYLNHDVLVFLMLGLFAAVPHAPQGAKYMPLWVLSLFRFQFAMIYLHAGIAKLQPDWLIAHEPLSIWLRAYGDWPLIGRLVTTDWAPAVMSWAGCLFDLLIVPALIWRRTRIWAFGAVVAFHALTGLLFPIGIFPILMIAGATIWLAPDWPRVLGFRAQLVVAPPSLPPLHRGWLALLGLWVAANILVPQRGLLSGKDVLWSGDGYRFSWRVMVAEKTGHALFTVKSPAAGLSWENDPAATLTPLQYREMTTEPDMLLYYAHHLCDSWAVAKGQGRPVKVYADAWLSLNGRRMARYVREDLDLCTVTSETAGDAWLLPRPE